jgi:RNA polymerase sigma-70 factor (ECF subfamily)
VLNATTTRGGAELHTLLLRAARFEVGRRHASLPASELEDIARAAADAAFARLQPELSTRRGDITTWAAKFAVVEAAASVRRGTWQGRPLPRSLAGPALVARLGDGPAAAALATSIEALPDNERRVLIAVALDDVPIDVVAERDGVPRAAVYATLQSARAKLRAELVAD